MSGEGAPGPPGEASPVAQGAGEDRSLPPASISALAETAITHLGPACASCGNVNHPGTAACVFCGHDLRPSGATVRVAHDSAERATPADAPAATTAPADKPSADAAATDAAADNTPPSVTNPALLATAAHAASHASSAALRRSRWSTPFDDLNLPVADPLIGVVVADRYRILEGLGRGGMGIVYKVEHKQIGKLLAMKLLTGELSRNAEVVRRFKHEALTSSRLSSPNTVQVFDFGVSEGLTYLVMELVAGEDLGRILRVSGPMPWARLGKVIIQVCSSLAEAHQKGIVHRDIKPENIMLVRARDGSEIAKVLDFGLAKLREGEGLSELTSAGAIVGTPYFMSPEQVRGDPVDARSDIYSLGALMYRALTGHYPFSGPTPMSVFTKHLSESPIPPADRAPELGIPPGVSRIVMRSLLKNPADRFQRVEDLQAAVVEQLKWLGTSSVEALLDSGAVRKLETAPAAAARREVIATRDEVERYERELRQKWYSAVGLLVTLVLGAAGAATKYLLSQRSEFSGAEREPNNVAADATPVPFGRTISAQLGRRIDASHGDRDFFAVTVPQPADGARDAAVRLGVTALPNIPMCTMIYRPGLSTALGQYCVGRPGRGLTIEALRLSPGPYFVAVLQDMDPYGAGAPPFIHENVSDSYEVTLSASDAPAGLEVEPNDQVASATSVVAGEPVTGVIGWVRDADVFCARAAVGERVIWRVTDSARDAGAVIEVTPMRGTEEGLAVRLHVTAGGKPSPTDVVGPWESAPAQIEPEVPRCVQVKLAADPWTADPWAKEREQSALLSGGAEPYRVEVHTEGQGPDPPPRR